MSQDNSDLIGTADTPAALPDPATIAPTKTHAKTSVVFPDLYNFMPSREVTQKEAQLRGWPYFFEGKKCTKYQHVAPRFTTNPRLCVSCHRIKCGKPALGAEGAQAATGKKARRPAAGGHPLIQVTDEHAQRFLAAYAEMRDVDGAANSMGWTVGKVEARIASDKMFREACERLGLKITPKAQTAYEWTEEKREQLLEVWINTGDIAAARDSIGVTPSEYLRETARNKVFAKRVEETEPLAERMLVERAYSLALAGNDKLLNKILPAVDPENFNTRARPDTSAKTLSDAQLEARFTSLLSKVKRPPALDEDEPEAPTIPDNSDLV